MFSGQSFEENIFEMYKNPATGLVNIGQILTVKHLNLNLNTDIFICMYLFRGCREDGGAKDGSEAGSDDEQADMLAMFDDVRKFEGLFQIIKSSQLTLAVII